MSQQSGPASAHRFAWRKAARAGVRLFDWALRPWPLVDWGAFKLLAERGSELPDV